MGEIEFTLSSPFLHTIALSLPPPPPRLGAPCAARGASEKGGGGGGYIQHYERDWVYPLFTPSSPFIRTIDLRLPPRSITFKTPSVRIPEHFKQNYLKFFPSAGRRG